MYLNYHSGPSYYDIRKWLEPPDPSTNYERALSKRQPCTGLWFLQGDAYAKWKTKNEDSSFLWLYGIPGSGKTVLSSTIIQNISETLVKEAGNSVAYFYFDVNDASKQDSDAMVKSLVIQLFQHKVPTALCQLFERCKETNSQPSTSSLLEILKQMVQERDRTYFIIDALDECGDVDAVMDIIQRMAQWSLPSVRVIATSRDKLEIRSSMEAFLDDQRTIGLGSQTVNPDIRLYIQGRLANDPQFKRWESSRNEIEGKLMNRADGM